MGGLGLCWVRAGLPSPHIGCHRAVIGSALECILVSCWNLLLGVVDDSEAAPKPQSHPIH